MTAEELIAFEQRVKDAFLAKQIHAPVHLSGGNERELIEAFTHLQPGDYVFSTWRSHFHALLKGIPPEWVYAEILAGRSMYLMNREHRFFSSAIVGGILPIALGVALGIKRNGGDETVWVFIGDMAARTGIYHEFAQYYRGHDLPVNVVIEDNGLSTDTPTEAAWGTSKASLKITRYHYERTQPHCGVGQHVAF